MSRHLYTCSWWCLRLRTTALGPHPLPSWVTVRTVVLSDSRGPIQGLLRWRPGRQQHTTVEGPLKEVVSSLTSLSWLICQVPEAPYHTNSMTSNSVSDPTLKNQVELSRGSFVGACNPSILLQRHFGVTESLPGFLEGSYAWLNVQIKLGEQKVSNRAITSSG